MSPSFLLEIPAEVGTGCLARLQAHSCTIALIINAVLDGRPVSASCLRPRQRLVASLGWPLLAKVRAAGHRKQVCRTKGPERGQDGDESKGIVAHVAGPHMNYKALYFTFLNCKSSVI